MKRNFETPDVSDKMKALLAIAGKVQLGGKNATTEEIARARQQRAIDKEIQDTVLIAAASCVYNRYVDGLATWAPDDVEWYRASGKRPAEEGYVNSIERPAAAQAQTKHA